MNRDRITSAYRIIKNSDGNAYQFFCDLSGGLVCTTNPIKAETEQEELMMAWESHGREHFNKCHKCGKWVISAMYNAEVLECVECSPFEGEPKFCKFCGCSVEKGQKNCPSCNRELIYEGCFT